MEFVGRQDETRRLRENNWRGQAQLIVVYGRRRVGKTALIEHAFADQTIWKFEGLESGDTKTQLRAFALQLQKYVGYRDTFSPAQISTWEAAFDLLGKSLANKRVVVFFDEFQWLAGMKGKFVSLFKFYWDNHFTRLHKCRFVICGSVSSFIVKKVLKSKALYGRVSTEINLKPLLFRETARFFAGMRTDDVLKIHMTLGGVPKYLLEYAPHLSYEQNINGNFLHQNGYFFQEFERVFISHFATHQHYRKILEQLARRNMTIEELANGCRIRKGGSFSRILDDLVLAGFVEKYHPINKPHGSRMLRCRLVDEYLHFYFTFIMPNIVRIQGGQLAFELINPQLLQQWYGYAYERFCLKHARQIAGHLQFGGVKFTAGSWFKSGGVNNAQIDLVFARADKVLTICEIKHVDKLQAGSLTDGFARKVSAIQEHFPSYATQKVLILAKKINVPANVSRSFSHVMFTEDFAMN